MREVQVTVPELALLVGTRAALGAGLGLLLAELLAREPTQGRWVDSPPGRRRQHSPSSRSRCFGKVRPLDPGRVTKRDPCDRRCPVGLRPEPQTDRSFSGDGLGDA